MKRSEILTAARDYLGTPYVHHGRLKGAGVDCVGLLVGVTRDLQQPIIDRSEYSPFGTGFINLTQELAKWFDPIFCHTALPGDILVFWIRRVNHAVHCGIKTDAGVIHTHSNIGKVVEHRLDASWEKRIMQAFRFRGLQD